MQRYSRSIEIHAPAEAVFHFHDDTSNLLKITPPGTKVEILSSTPPGKGQVVHLLVTQLGFLKNHWEVEITDYDPPFLMRDVQLKGPFHAWTQTREITAITASKTRLTDTVVYELPLHVIGDFFAGKFVAAEIEKMFAYRQMKTKSLLEEMHSTKATDARI